MRNLESKIESILLFTNEPVSVREMGKWLNETPEVIKEALESLRKFYRDRGIVIIFDGESVSFGTHPDNSETIEHLAKEELSRELGPAGLETLTIILYKGPISRREIDHIRGVNSSFILRSLLIRGLIERVDPASIDEKVIGRSYIYKPTLKLFEHLGVTSREDLPEYGKAFAKLEEFSTSTIVEENG